MKALDKIYMLPEELDERREWITKPYEDRDVAYIRKDAILKWAKKELETRRNTGDDYYLPAIVVLNDLIEKLNSMTQEEKQLLINDLYARVPYGIKVWYPNGNGVISTVKGIVDDICYFNENPRYGNCCPIESVKPYLRPMSSMTDEEKKEYKSFFSIGEYSCGGSLNGEEYEYIADSRDDISQSVSLFDWLNAHHFDYRGLIEDGLALEAPEDMYKTE